MNQKHWNIRGIGALFRKRKLSPVEVARDMLNRIERMDPILSAFITVTPDLALAQARRAEREIMKGESRGPLHGIPITLKDIIFVRGIRNTCGSRILANAIADRDAAVWSRLAQAGCVLLGKTNLHEFAYGVTSVNPHFGAVRNPWNPDHMAGGSSGGSAAAVAAGIGLGSVGTDTGGSIRIPSSACGVVGLKPGFGRVPLVGVIPLSPSLDHVGPICRSVEDAALMLEVMADPGTTGKHGGSRRGIFTSSLRAGLRGLRIGMPEDYFFTRLQPAVRQGVLDAVSVMEANGAEIRTVRLEGMKETADLASVITLAEALAFHWLNIKRRPEDYGADLRKRLRDGLGLTALEYLRAQQRRTLYAERFERALEKVDFLAAPTLPAVAPPLAAEKVTTAGRLEDVRLALLRLTRPGNLTGLPAISVPCGFSKQGLPFGLQLIGRRGGEGVILRAAHAYEEATSWTRRCPPVTLRTHAAAESS